MITNQIADLNNLLAVANSGVCKVFAMPRHQILWMPKKKDMLTHTGSNQDSISLSNISTIPGATWIGITNDNQLNTELEEVDTPNEQNKFFKYQIAFQLPGDSVSRGRIIQTFDAMRWVIIIKESTGTWRILGEYDAACVFESSLKTGSQTKSGNVNKCAFLFDSRHRALYLNNPETSPQVILDTLTSIGSGNVEAEFKLLYFPVHNVSGMTFRQDCYFQAYINNKWTTFGTVTNQQNGTHTVTFASNPVITGIQQYRIATSENFFSEAVLLSL